MSRFALVGLLALMTVGCDRAPVAPPHVVLVVLDTVRSDAVSANGHPVALTPVVDELAASGVNFGAAYAHSTWTKPSMATLFTGAFADRHLVRTPTEEVEGRHFATRLGGQLHTLAERLREGGFTTAAFVNQVHLQPKFGFDQGFDHYVWSTGLSADEVNEGLLGWLETAPEGPTFVYLHYLDPHWPYVERVEELREALGSLGVDPRPPNDGSRVDEWLAAGPAPGSIEGLRGRYDHGVAYADRALGYALEHLDRAGLVEDAVVVVTSDHGEGFLEHGRLQHGYPPYDEGLHVPLVIRPPERMGFAPRTVTQPIGLVDVMPTVLDLVGLPPTEKGDRGRSLVPLMRGESQRERPIYAEVTGVRAIRFGDYKLLRHPDGRRELFDLDTDPLEAHPLECDRRCDELSRQLDLLTALAATYEDDLEAAEVELDEQDLERLRSLGYLDN